MTALLGDFVNITTGKLDANAATQDGKYPFFTCSKNSLKIDNYAFDADAVLIAGNGDLNVKHYKGKFNAYQRTYVVTVSDLEILDSRYLYHWMSKYVDRLRELSIGGVIKYIKLGMLTGAEIPLPPLEEQKSIAAILDKADAIRRKRQQAIDLANQFLSSVFLDMFGNPVANPRGWKQDLLGDLVDSDRGISYGIVQRGNEVSDGVPVIRIGNIRSNSFNETNLVKTDKLISDKFKRTILRGGELLLGIRGTVGNVAMATEKCIGSNVSREIAVIPIKKLPAQYVQYVILSGGVQKFLKDEIKGVAQKGINLSLVRAIPVSIPDDESLSKFVQIVAMTKTIVGQFSSRDDLTSHLFDSISSKAFKGELIKNKAA